jgi:hypothetical protein
VRTAPACTWRCAGGTGASPKGAYVRLLKFPAEGRAVRDAQGIDVGDKVQVCLAAVDVAKGFIDFERRLDFSCLASQ